MNNMGETKWLQKEAHFDWMQKCLSCWKMCEEFIAWSIENKKFVDSLNKFRDTSEMCSQCMKFEAEQSPFLQQLCEVCAQVCDACVTEMEQHENEELIIANTLDSCRDFANACKEIAEQRHVGDQID